MTDTQHRYLEEMSKHIEVLLHASEAPLTAASLKKHLSVTTNTLNQALDLLEQRLKANVLSLHKTASGYRLQIADSYSPLIQRVFPQRQERLSQALLETLSVIAYKQPVTRGDIEHVRGVTLSSNILRQLFDKGWIEEKGYKDTLGRPALLHTTSQFLDAFGLTNLDELPALPNMEAIKTLS
ncbi:segregation and condensation protein B [Psychrobacter luti]|uniref:Segregation and condensation protein B n=1 Tax=Psychrobacter luti TaxID=198481 RepID=A0A839TDW4_9GAMM|nr:SMC-Scp complex subunit ScpB [Psychrobacter luti]MBB3107270.1 segregation and condensation protein B [Psychrobacter luti]